MPANSFGTFISDVRTMGQFSSNLETVQVIQATLRTLSECIPGPEANELASTMPGPFAASLRCEDWQRGEQFSSSEFVQRVALRERTNLSEARRHIDVVFSALCKVLPQEAIERLRETLPLDYGTLFFGEPVLETVHMHQPIQ